MFEFNPSEDYILSFYLYNLKDQSIDLELKLSDTNNQWKEAQTITIAKEADYISLKEYAEDLCE